MRCGAFVEPWAGAGAGAWIGPGGLHGLYWPWGWDRAWGRSRVLGVQSSHMGSEQDPNQNLHFGV